MKERNNPTVALRYFGLLMMGSSDDLVPSMETAAVDGWVKIKSDRGDEF